MGGVGPVGGWMCKLGRPPSCFFSEGTQWHSFCLFFAAFGGFSLVTWKFRSQESAACLCTFFLGIFPQFFIFLLFFFFFFAVSFAVFALFLLHVPLSAYH